MYSMSTWIVFPNQIFLLENVKSFLEKYKIKQIILIEHPIYFGTDPERLIPMNKLKLILHRACFYFYKDYLESKNFKVRHIKVNEYLLETLVLPESKVYYIDVPDYLLDKRMKEAFPSIERLDEHPNYYLNKKDIQDFFDSRKGKKRTQHDDYYRWTRKRFNILMDNGKPEGGSLSYDKYNRSPPPTTKIQFPELPTIDSESQVYVERAKKEIEKEFPKNPGTLDFYLPITFRGAQKWFDNFLKERLLNFGKYEDAVVQGEPFMYHGVLSPLLNCGLLDPVKVCHLAEEAYYHIKKPEVLQASRVRFDFEEPLHSVEGFIRQILGWREWQRIQYLTNYKKLINGNYYNNNNTLNKKWWSGELGVKPIDDTIKMGFRYGYLHHILRLMYMSNFMNLCRIHPHEMYRWFMSFPMDSYDWVMIQNVYSMGAGMNMTKPYITTGNYIVKMSDYKKDLKWMNLWEALYYCFLEDNEEQLMAFPRVGGIMRKNLHRKSEEKMKEYRNMMNHFMGK
jgi:deoxyribodipyrimidine photolyase-related protein